MIECIKIEDLGIEMRFDDSLREISIGNQCGEFFRSSGIMRLIFYYLRLLAIKANDTCGHETLLEIKNVLDILINRDK